MRHRVRGRRLGRDSAHRKALYKNMIADLFCHERIYTTEAKARAAEARAREIDTAAAPLQAALALTIGREDVVDRMIADQKREHARALALRSEGG